MCLLWPSMEVGNPPRHHNTTLKRFPKKTKSSCCNRKRVSKRLRAGNLQKGHGSFAHHIKSFWAYLQIPLMLVSGNGTTKFAQDFLREEFHGNHSSSAMDAAIPYLASAHWLYQAEVLPSCPVGKESLQVNVWHKPLVSTGRSSAA